MKKYFLYAGLGLLLLTTACTKDFKDINTDPTQYSPGNFDANYFLSSSQSNYAGAISGYAGPILFQSGWVQIFSMATVTGDYYTNADKYLASSNTNSYVQSSWNNGYRSASLANEILLNHKEDADWVNINAAATIMKVLNMQYVTDVYGDIPYSEAGQGLDDAGFPKFPQPLFDEQKDIYSGNSSKGVKSLFDLVREGLADIAANGPARPGVDPGSDDVVYNGDLSKWTRFGNSLLMKFALQVSNRLPDTTTKIIKDIIDNNKPFINAMDGSLDFNVSFTLNNPNPYYLQDIGGSIPNTQMLSNRFLVLERSLNDSLRLSRLYIKPAATFIGYDNGSPFIAPTPTQRSYYGTYVLGASRRGEAPLRLITAFRNYFILAEAALRFGVTGNANTYYQNGIRASMTSMGMSTAEIDAYFAANPTIVTLSGTDQQKLNQIITQKYIASIGNAIESYNDYRRTGYPVLAKPMQTFGDDPNTFPNRLPYTISEGSANPNQPNPRPLTSTKVWWAL